jgi:hypothetical protein
LAGSECDEPVGHALPPAVAVHGAGFALANHVPTRPIEPEPAPTHANGSGRAQSAVRQRPVSTSISTHRSAVVGDGSSTAKLQIASARRLGATKSSASVMPHDSAVATRPGDSAP